MRLLSRCFLYVVSQGLERTSVMSTNAVGQAHDVRADIIPTSESSNPVQRPRYAKAVALRQGITSYLGSFRLGLCSLLRCLSSCLLRLLCSCL